MPVYEFACKRCSTGFEELTKRDDPPPACPACGSKRTARQISPSNFFLKGTGWYKTDFKNNK